MIAQSPFMWRNRLKFITEMRCGWVGAALQHADSPSRQPCEYRYTRQSSCNDRRDDVPALLKEEVRNRSIKLSRLDLIISFFTSSIGDT